MTQLPDRGVLLSNNFKILNNDMLDINAPALAALLSSSAFSVTNYAALRNSSLNATTIYVQGALAPSDGGQGFFTLVIGNATDDGGTVISLNNGTYYQRIYSGAMHINWFGGFTGAACQAAINAAVTAGKSITADAGLYNMGPNGLVFSQNISNFTFLADPAAIFQSTGNGTYPIFKFTGVGANFNWIGGQYQYQTAPTGTRLADTLDFFGNAISNMYIADICVNNGANFGVWVQGLAASGSINLVARNIQVSNTLGDGFHVENFDNLVVIDGVVGLNNGDDVCAVINYTAIHPNPTYDVQVSNVTSLNPTFGVVKLFGVNGFTCSNITAHGGANTNSATGCVVQLGVGLGYGTALVNGTFNNITGTNMPTILLGGVGSGIEIGNVSFDNIVGYNCSNALVSMVNTNTSNVHDINFGTLIGFGPLNGVTIGIWMTYLNNVTFKEIQITGFYQNLFVSYCTNITFNGTINSTDAYNTGGANSFGVQIQYNTNLVLNDVTYKIVNSPGTKNGIIVNFNTVVETRGLFVCNYNALLTTQYIFGSNTSVKGFIDRIYYNVSGKAVTSGTAFTINFSQAVDGSGLFVPLAPVVTAGTPQVLGVTAINGSLVTLMPTATGTISVAGIVEVMLN